MRSILMAGVAVPAIVSTTPSYAADRFTLSKIAVQECG
jgi:hypothetical protein